MSGNNLGQGIRADDAALPKVQDTPADAKSSDAMLFKEYLSGGGRTNDAAARTNSGGSSSGDYLDEDSSDMGEFRLWQSENSVREFIDSGQVEFPCSASAEDPETHLGIPGWQNLSDVSPELAQDVQGEISVSMNHRNEITQTAQVISPSPTAASAALRFANSVIPASTAPANVGTVALLDADNGNTSTGGGSSSVAAGGTDSTVPSGPAATINPDDNTIQASGVDTDGREFVVVADPLAGVVVIDSNTGEIISASAIDIETGAQSPINSAEQPMQNNPHVNTFTNPNATDGLGNPATAIRVELADGTLLYEVYTSDTVNPHSIVTVIGPDGLPMPGGILVPDVPVVPNTEQTPAPGNSQDNPETGSGNTPPLNMTTDDAYENQQEDLPVDFSTDGAKHKHKHKHKHKQVAVVVAVVPVVPAVPLVAVVAVWVPVYRQQVPMLREHHFKLAA